MDGRAAPTGAARRDLVAVAGPARFRSLAHSNAERHLLTTPEPVGCATRTGWSSSRCQSKQALTGQAHGDRGRGVPATPPCVNKTDYRANPTRLDRSLAPAAGEGRRPQHDRVRVVDAPGRAQSLTSTQGDCARVLSPVRLAAADGSEIDRCPRRGSVGRGEPCWASFVDAEKRRKLGVGPGRVRSGVAQVQR